MNISSNIASKYIKFKKKDRNIALMIKICFLGITIGTFCLMLTLIITNGFEKVIHEKMQGINSQVIIYSPGNKVDYQAIKKFLLHNFPNEIKGISGNSTRQVLIDKNKSHSVLFLKGIDPENENKVTNIAQKITFPVFEKKTTHEELLKNLLQNNQIIIGEKTAKHYNLKTGDQIKILIPESGGKKKIFLKDKKVTIAGIFKVGLEEYDNNLAFISIDFLQKLFEEDKGVDQINLKLKDNNRTTFSDLKQSFKNIFTSNNLNKKELFINFLNQTKNFVKQVIFNIFRPIDPEAITIQKIKSALPMLSVNSWKDLYPALVSSLKLEKYVMFFILALITFVACMTMISLLFMYIQQKRRDIAIFKTMGLSDKKIRSIFLRIGIKITFWAATCGLLLAAIAGFFLERYPFIQLPDVYYVSYLPARMDLEIFIVVFFATMLLGFLATWIPAQMTKKINIAQVLRQE